MRDEESGAQEDRTMTLTTVLARLRDDSGQDLIEYALLAALIALAAVVAIGTAGDQVNAIWERIVTALSAA
jgi:pilus assembly protein Flp/PilA